MQGAPRRQVNAEDMLAELKRALESSTHTPDAPPPSPSTAPKPSLPGPATGRSQIDNGSGRPAKANTDKPTRPRTELQRSTRPNSRSWKLIAGGLALAVAATIGVSFAFMGKPSNLPEPEPTVAATGSPARPQNEQTPEPSSSPQALMQDSQQAAPLQAGNLGTRPDASTAPLIGGSLSAGGKAEVDAPNLASSGLETAVPASTPVPPSSPAIWVPSQRIRPDGTPVANAPSAPASAPPLAQTPKPPAASAAPQMVKPDKASLATAPPAPASTASAPPLGEAPKPATSTAAPQMGKPDKASVATAPLAPASTASAPPPAEAPKPSAKQTASVSNESAEPSKPKIDSKRKPTEKISRQKPAKSDKASAKPIPAERQSTEPPPPKEAESPPHPAKDVGNPTAAAPLKTTSVQQRVADGVTHAFGYLIHLPGALVPHLGGPNPDAH
jgi:hypothetical protein